MKLDGGSLPSAYQPLPDVTLSDLTSVRFVGRADPDPRHDGDREAVLQAPDFDAVFEWRWQQEQRLSEQFQRRHPDSADPTMGRDEVANFVLHYQRLTEHALRTLPDRANFVWELEPDRSVKRLRLTGVAA